ncbi:MAG TPA: class I SAM-dependent methyltransferase [Candidatus Dormibacteraeota bacterium]|nr:class I SAM-dependent methyltransferase [Candidatus Dormibacteraeota bacterium]
MTTRRFTFHPFYLARLAEGARVGNPETGDLTISSAETERVRRIWEKLAPRYDKDIKLFEKILFAGGRQWVCSQARGEVLEMGVGTGRNLEHYPQGIRLTGIDISAPMLDIARHRASELAREVDFRVGDAQALEFADESFDTVVFTLSLCSIPDDRKAISEAKRVLRPGGRLLLLEHVASPWWPVRTVQQLLDWITVRTVGDHLVRNPLVRVQAQGFEVGRIERLKWGIVERVTASKPT